MKISSESTKYLNILSKFGVISTVKEHTTVVVKSKSCVDHIFLKTDTSHDLLLLIEIKTNLTNHYSVYLYTIIETTKCTYIVPKSILSKIDYIKLKNSFSKLLGF